MKLKYLTLIVILASSAVALGLEGVQKSNIKLPFHSKIDVTASDKEKLENQMQDLYDKEDPGTEKKSKEEKMVSDFVDVEVHWGGKNENVVDRRMNSVNDLPVIDETDL